MDTRRKCMPDTSSCAITKQEPNILRNTHTQRFVYLRRARVNILVHNRFFINMTLVRFKLNDQMGFHTDGCVEIGDGSQNRFRLSKDQYPMTLIGIGNSMYIHFEDSYLESLIIEYGIMHNSNISRSVGHFSREALQFPWSYFRVRCFKIIVHTVMKVVVHLTPDLVSSILIYDGPNEIFPLILTLSVTDSHITNTVEASTFQIFLVLIEEHESNLIMKYKSKAHKSNIIILTQNDHHLLEFNNKTHCGNHTLTVRACMFDIYGIESRNIRMLITQLHFDGVYRSKEFAAGIIFTHVIDEKEHSFLEAGDDIFILNQKHVQFTISSGKLTILVYEYSAYATVTFRINISLTQCTGYFLAIRPPSWKQYITWSVVEEKNNYQYRLNMKLSNTMACSRLYIFHKSMASFKSRMVIFDPEIHAKIGVSNTIMYHKPTITKMCFINAAAITGVFYGFHSKAFQNFFYSAFYGNPHSILFDATCVSKFVFHTISIQYIPCKLPCNVIGTGFGFVYPYTYCDICDQAYVGAYQGFKFLKSRTLIRFRVFPCKSLALNFGTSWRALQMYLGIARNLTIRTPDMSSFLTYEDECRAEISRDSINITKPHRKRSDIWQGLRMLTKSWGGHSYILLSKYGGPVSWEMAESYCWSHDGKLLTIDSIDEYRFIESNLMARHQMMVIFIGIKSLVSKLNNADLNT